MKTITDGMKDVISACAKRRGIPVEDVRYDIQPGLVSVKTGPNQEERDELSRDGYAASNGWVPIWYNTNAT